MYERIAEKITNFVLATLKKEMLLDLAANGHRPKPKRARKLKKQIRDLTPRVSPSMELENVVQKMLAADTPARKAHATMALRKYSENRAAEIGSTPERVVAGVRASVTKRKSCSTN